MKVEQALAGLSSEATRATYRAGIAALARHAGTDAERMAEWEGARIDAEMVSWIEAMVARGLRTSSVRTHLAGAERFFVMADKVWHRERIRKSIMDDGAILGGGEPATDADVRAMLRACRGDRARALVRFFASTGCRPGALEDLKWENMGSVGGFECIDAYPGTREAYTVFLTPGASAALDRIRGTGFLFESKKGGVLGARAARRVLARAARRAGVWDGDADGRHAKAPVYMMRKRFNTILKSTPGVNANIAEKLMGHKKGLDGTYFKPTRGQCAAEFAKVAGVLDA